MHPPYEVITSHCPQRLRRLLAAGLDPEAVPIPGTGQASVWDFPRPPSLAGEHRRLRVQFAGRIIGDSTFGYRLCETASPPTYYFPAESVLPEVLVPNRHRSLCEWKGQARYFDVVLGEKRAANAAWCYPDARAPFEALSGCIAFMPAMMDCCYVDDEQARAQTGGFYGGWITDDLTGPFKGMPGTLHW